MRFFRQRNRVTGALLQPIIFWLLFSEGLKSRELNYAHFFPGTLAMIILFTAIFATVSIIEDRREGFLQGVLVAPIPRWGIVLGKIIGATLIAMIQALIFFLLGWLTVQEVNPSGTGVLFALLLMGVVSLSLTSLGFFIAWRMESVQGYHAIMSLVLFPMWLISAAFFPAGGGGWLAPLIRVNPLTYGVEGLRHYLQYTAGPDGSTDAARWADPTTCWIVSILFAVVMLVACWNIAKTRTTADLL